MTEGEGEGEDILDHTPWTIIHVHWMVDNYSAWWLVHGLGHTLLLGVAKFHVRTDQITRLEKLS